MPKWNNQEIVPFTEEEVRRLLKACDHSKSIISTSRKPYQFSRSTALRDRCLLLVLLDTGVRAGELCRLRRQDINLENGEVSVKPYHVGKTRPRTVYLGKETRKLLWKYLVTREDLRPDDPLFVTIEGNPLCPRQMEKVITNLAERGDVQDAHPHKFRHTFAIQYLRNGGDVFTLQRLLGHATLEMTRRYVAIAQCDTADAHRRASPVDRWKL